MGNIYNTTEDVDTGAVTQFQSIWRGALDKYRAQTKRNMAEMLKDKDIESADQLCDLIRDQKARQQVSRAEGQKTRDVLKACVRPIVVLGDVGKSALSLTPFAPASVILGAGLFLVGACDGVSKAYTAVEQLLEECYEFTKRLEQYAKVKMDGHLLEKVTAILTSMLDIFGRCEEAMVSSRIGLYFESVFLGKKNQILQDNVDKLNKYFDQEERFNIAQIFVDGRVTRDQVAKMREQHDLEAKRAHEEKLQQDVLSIPLGPIDITAKQAEDVRKSKSSPPTWISSNETFKTWFEGTQSRNCLWGFGNAGSGKTSLVSYLTKSWSSQPAEQLMKSADQVPHHVLGLTGEIELKAQWHPAIALFYCNYRYKDEQSPDAIFKSLVGQLLRQLLLIAPHRARGRVNQMNPPVDKPSSSVNWTSMLDNLISEFQQTFIVIDALDENEAGYTELVARLGRLKSRSLKLFVTSRDEDVMRRDARAGHALEMVIHAKDEYIHSYVEARLTRISQRDEDSEPIGTSALPEFLNSGRLIEVSKRIVSVSEGNFYYAELQVTTLKAETTVEELQTSLNSLAAKSLSDVIRGAIDRIRGQKNNDLLLIGMKTLMWAVYAGRTLNIEELRHAVALTIRPHTREDAEAQKAEVARLPPHVLVEATRYFIRVDEKTGQVGVHKAIKDYCDQANIFEDAHYQMAETCLMFLDRRFFQLRCDSKLEYDRRRKEHPFFEYSSRNWGWHMRKAGEGRFLTHESPVSMRTLLSRTMFLNCISVALHEELKNYRMWDWHGHDPWKTIRERVNPVLLPAHLLVYFNLHRTLDWWLRENPRDVGRVSRTGTAPLYLACSLGRVRIVETLLFDFNANPAAKGAEPSGFNLAAGVFVQSPEIVERLLYVNRELVKQTNWHERQPLGEAVMRENTEVVRILIDAIGILPDSASVLLHQETNDHWGALHEAVGAAHPNLKAMELLLNAKGGKQLLTQRTKKWQDTPLHVAAAKGHPAAVQVLLNHGADPMARQVLGQTALHVAAHGLFDRNRDVIKTLLKHTDPTAQAHNGFTAWHFAVKMGRPRVLRLLIEHGPQTLFRVKNNDSATPIRLAVNLKGNCWIECVQILLEKCPGELEVEDAYVVLDRLIHERDDDAELALRKLLEHPVEPWPFHSGNTTVLHRIIHLGTLKMVKTAWELLGSDRILNYRDAGGSTPLVLACNIRDPAKVGFLIDHGPDLNVQDNTGRTALHYTIERDMPRMTGLLLDKRAYYNIKDNDGVMALERASAQNHCRNDVWQFKAAMRPRNDHAQHRIIAARKVEKQYTISHEDSKKKLITEGIAKETIYTKSKDYVRTDALPPTAKLPLLRVDVSVTWSVERMQFSGDAWVDLAIYRGGRLELTRMFCQLLRRGDGTGQTSRQTHSASWHVLDGLVNMVGMDDEYGPREDKRNRIINFLKTIRIGDQLALVAMVAGTETVQVIESAEISAVYED